MKRLWTPLRLSKRFVRRRAPPVEWLKDATTYADTHTTMYDPHSGTPYQEQDVHEIMEEKQKSQTFVSRDRFKRKTITTLNFDHIPIEDRVVVLFPGQGSQVVGMGEKLMDNPQSVELFERANSVLGYNLLEVCRKGPKTKLDQTIYCQPAVFVASLAALNKLRSEQPDIDERITNVAGFSVGEFSALVLAEVLSFEDALKIVQKRAEAMHECCQQVSSGMVTVRVTAASQLDLAMAEAKELAVSTGEYPPICEVANYLFCGVKVIGASNTCMEFLESNADRFKFQVVKRLQVSGAFHTSLMTPAADVLAKALNEVRLGDARMNIYSNYTGKIYSRKTKIIRENIVKQVDNPVKWEQTMQLLYRLHQDYHFPSFFEVGPGRQLGATLLQVSKKAYKHYVNFPC
jgi:[acyl-carrier-protein] S-malonyltransferase